MKIRLYRGPFDGKVIHHHDGAPSFVLNGIKPLSAKKKYKSMVNAASKYMPVNAFAIPDMRIITATYRRTPYIHPDGSTFYEWAEPRRPKT